MEEQDNKGAKVCVAGYDNRDTRIVGGNHGTFKCGWNVGKVIGVVGTCAWASLGSIRLTRRQVTCIGRQGGEGSTIFPLAFPVPLVRGGGVAELIGDSDDADESTVRRDS